MHSGPHMHATGRKLEGVEVVPEHVLAQEAVYALQVLLCLPLWTEIKRRDVHSRICSCQCVT